MPFFDFHLHPSLKCLFSEGPEKLSPWDKIDTRKIPMLLRWCSEFEYILQSQASSGQLVYNECRLICVALYAPEKAMLDNSLILGQADGSLGTYLNKQRILKIISSELQPYRDVVTDDLNTLLNASQFGITDRKLMPLTKAADYNEGADNTVFVVFSVEGCHSLSSALGKFNVDEIITNLDDLRNKVPLLSVNLTHLEQSTLCNHAFGMQFINDEAFKPTGKTISQAGIRVLQHCYQNKILIDVKHMSLGARRLLYSLRQSDTFTGINQPLVCTHAGFTGITFAEIPDYIFDFRSHRQGYVKILNGKPVKYGNAPRPSFNSSSINLYDEDIMAILESGGIIGLSLDKRILGFHEYEPATSSREDYPMETEFISSQEEAYFFTKDEVGNAFLDGHCIDFNEVEEGGAVNPFLKDYHLRHFMAHIVHLIVVAERHGYDVNKALTQVCIGSDFDGIINPIWSCDTVDELAYFKSSFERFFQDFADECTANNNFRLPADFDIRKFSQQLFYENGKTFVLGRLTAIG